ncbi:DUF2809 domain-containing protein [Kitasatospora sp. NPDC094015]|uniref:ribosomal maturation YjgA family protein n=1 Tax=Kitasatospora sp. NPDC094015 TaxID=3155205 RepID=UPI00331BFB56
MTDRRPPGGPGRTRVLAGAAAAATVAAGLLVRAAPVGEWAKPAGDLLYTVLLQTLVVLAVPRLRPAAAAGLALAAGWAVEFFQLTGIPAELSARSGIARLVLGSTFNPPDLGWYAAGAALGLLVHAALVHAPPVHALSVRRWRSAGRRARG